ncbi:DUF3558 domain-containing protein [Saccharopolyspora erythraea]|uniref:DUF3558 domain-containing protein n=1 Tax=Saccharopolyspora erythraea TaxID=1836 RepID=UPI002012D692|nr:DUF3558 domain-containing protein [Saccharopolyspora erythraea]
MIGSVAASLVLAGCGGSTEGQTPPGGQVPSATASEGQGAPRTGPAKAVEIADKCSVVSESQWKAAGADQKPRERTSNDKPGCQYQKGMAGTPGWGAFVAVSGGASYAQTIGETAREPVKVGDVAGYPVTEFKIGDGCVLYADVADNGFLIANVTKLSPEDPGADLCQVAERFTEAAVQNLPNA